MRLSNFDLERVLFSVNQLNADHEPESLPQRTMDAVRSLVPTDVVSFEGFGEDSHYQGPLWYAPLESVSNQMLAAMSEYVSDHPCFDGTAAKSLQSVVRVSDFMSLVNFKQTTIYNEFFRHLGTERQIAAPLHISPELMISCSLCRPGKDYTERDCRLIALLVPHLTAAFRQAKFIHRIKFESEQLRTALEFAKLAIVTVDGKLDRQVATAAATRILHKYFGRESALLPKVLREYIRYHHRIFVGDEFYLPPQPFEKRQANGKLVVRVVFQSLSDTIILLLEEISSAPVADRNGFGLTDRENEVLAWVGQGKTDGEIGKILGISIRTVQKHVENIFNKLGVETRTAATSAVNGKNR